MDVMDALFQGNGPFLLMFAAVVLGVYALAGLLRSGDAVERRLQNQGGGEEALRPTLRHGDGFWAALFSRRAAPLTPEGAAVRSAVRRRLMQAGFPAPNAVATYFGARIMLSVALPVAFMAALPFLPGDWPARKVGMVAAIAAMSGYLLPAFYVGHRISVRQTIAREGFPDTLDLLLVCVQAGLGLDAAIARVGEEILRSHPLLGEQFRLLGLEVRAGASRETALRNLSERIGIDEIKSLVTLLIQSDQLGTSIADALRAHAEDMRGRRLMRAEEKAQELPVKLTVPLILCILPALMVGVMTPAVIRILRTIVQSNPGRLRRWRHAPRPPAALGSLKPDPAGLRPGRAAAGFRAGNQRRARREPGPRPLCARQGASGIRPPWSGRHHAARRGRGRSALAGRSERPGRRL
ncbi:MAG: type II secretion system F family protein [Rhodospirillales bacterium]|nr:type II secretion system F family protein [Rhodospirillales bacterium]